MSSSVNKTRFIVKSLYRNLLRAAAPFTAPSEDAIAFTCLLQRQGVGWTGDLVQSLRDQTAGLTATTTSSSSQGHPEDNDDVDRIYFACLVQTLIAGNGPGRARELQFPVHLEDGDTVLRRLIQKEFRSSLLGTSDVFFAARRRVAFLALRKINEKLNWYHDLKERQKQQKEAFPDQKIPALIPLNLYKPSSYLKPGTFLVAHPNLNGYFRRSVICILDHYTSDDDDNDDNADNHRDGGAHVFSSGKVYGTYGLVVNKWSSDLEDGGKSTKRFSMNEIFAKLPQEFRQVFGTCEVRQGGPVHGSLQMLHALPPSHDYLDRLEELGGIQIPMLPPASRTKVNNSEEKEEEDSKLSVAVDGYNRDQEPAIFYKGNVFHVAKAVAQGHLALNSQVQFFVGASTWAPGQLQGEVERGTWLPCWAPPSIAFHPPAGNGDELWRHMLASCGPEEAKLANLAWFDDGKHEYGGPCDELDDI